MPASLCIMHKVNIATWAHPYREYQIVQLIITLDAVWQTLQSIASMELVSPLLTPMLFQIALHVWVLVS